MKDQSQPKPVNFVFYDKRTGEITFFGMAGSFDQVGKPRHGQGKAICDENVTAKTHYFDLALNKLAPKQPSRAGVWNNRLVGLPIGGTLTVYGKAYPIEAEEVELDFNIPGPHEVRVKAAKYLEAVIILPDEG